ncbi:acyltransferase family protein [bacterium]|nr:acyltransferase family protein [bacterium]
MEKRCIYFDILRIIACFAVIVIHICSWYLYSDINSTNWQVFNFYNSIVKWAVPIFVMISGALFLKANYSVGELYKNKILRIFISLCFWSVVYCIYIVYVNKNFDLKFILLSLITLKGKIHLWFLYMIMGLYILVPFLKKIVEDKFLIKYFLILAVLFNFIIPKLISIISSFQKDSDILFNSFVLSCNNFNLYFVLGYTSYFILGHFLDTEIFDEKKIKYIYLLGICGFILTIFLSNAYIHYLGKFDELFYDYLTFNIFLETICVFVFIRKNCENFKFSDKQKNIIIKFSTYSFGAYLVHYLIIDILIRFCGFTPISFNPLFSVPIIGIIVFAVSFFISSLLNKIPFLNKYIV